MKSFTIDKQVFEKKLVLKSLIFSLEGSNRYVFCYTLTINTARYLDMKSVMVVAYGIKIEVKLLSAFNSALVEEQQLLFSKYQLFRKC